MKSAAYFACVLAFLTLSGCASYVGAPEPIVDVEKELAVLAPHYDSDKIVQYYSSPASERTAVRNEIVTSRMHALDLRFSQFERDVARESRGGGFFSSLVSLGLTGAATLVGGESTKAILAGADTALKGGVNAYKEEVLIDRTLQVLLTQMQTNRRRVAAKIWGNLAKPDSQYPLVIALSQVDDYYRAGTFAGALATVNEQAGMDSAKAVREFDTAITNLQFPENDETYTDLKALVVAPDGRIDPAKIAPLRACMTEANVPEGTSLIVMFDSPDLVEERRVVAACLSGAG